MTKVAQAVAMTPNTNRKLAELVDKATTAQNPDLPIEDFIAAATDVAEHAVLGYRDGATLSRALHELERAVRQRQVWDDTPAALVGHARGGPDARAHRARATARGHGAVVQHGRHPRQAVRARAAAGGGRQ
jgi:hypothetical protein